MTGWNPTTPKPAGSDWGAGGSGPAAVAPTTHLRRIPPDRWHLPSTCGPLVHVPRGGACPACGAPTSEARSAQLPLPGFRHGGFGAAVEAVTQACTVCRWQLLRSVGEIRPP